MPNFGSQREELLQIVSHELKNPLTAFSLQTRILQDILKSEEQFRAHELVSKLTRDCEINVKRMEIILNKMITILDSQAS